MKHVFTHFDELDTRSPLHERSLRFDRAMRLMTFPALAVLLVLPVGAMWGAVGWVDAGKVALTIVVVWLVFAMSAAATWQRRP